MFSNLPADSSHAVLACRGAKPQPPEAGRTADLPLYCTAFQDRLTLYRDLSGVSLHRRGYRRAMHRCNGKDTATSVDKHALMVARKPREDMHFRLCGPVAGLAEHCLRLHWSFQWNCREPTLLGLVTSCTSI